MLLEALQASDPDSTGYLSYAAVKQVWGDVCVSVCGRSMNSDVVGRCRCIGISLSHAAVEQAGLIGEGQNERPG